MAVYGVDITRRRISSLPALKVEAARLPHIRDARRRIARRHPDHIRRLLHLVVVAPFVKALPADVAGDVVLPFLHLHLHLVVVVLVVGKVIVLHHGYGWGHHHVGGAVLRHFFYFYLLGIMRLPRQHQLPTHLVSLVPRSLMVIRLTIFFHFFDPVSVSQGVEGVLGACVGGADVGDHGGATVPSKGISQHFGKLTPAEGQMLLLEVEGSDAFF